MMKTTLLTIVLCALAFSPVNAQDKGTTPGQMGKMWMTDQQNEKDAIAQFEARLRGMNLNEWKAEAVAWMEFSSSDRQFDFLSPYRIGGADADRKAHSSIAPDSTKERPHWLVSFGKKEPRKVMLTLTDINRTVVECSANGIRKDGAGYVGVFQAEFSLLCLSRPFS